MRAVRGALYIDPAIGRVSLSKLEAGDVARMLARLSARGDLSNTTIGCARAVLRIALGRALKAGLVVRNVATLVDAPARTRAEMRPMTAQEASTFLTIVDGDRMGRLFTLAIATGMRQGELLGLRWQDVDPDIASLVVRQTLG